MDINKYHNLDEEKWSGALWNQKEYIVELLFRDTCWWSQFLILVELGGGLYFSQYTLVTIVMNYQIYYIIH